jgi:tetratricopeptide (TPR) repeat protein
VRGVVNIEEFPMPTVVKGKFAEIPAVWNLFYSRNPYFVGREHLLNDLHRGFAAQANARRRQVLVGVGGVGKTAIAVEYAYANAADYDIIWWVRAETRSMMAVDMGALAARLTSDGRLIDDIADAWRIARRLLEQRDRWLLIFDNAQRSEDLAEFLPRNPAGRVLVATSNMSWEPASEALLVDRWTRRESLDFLNRRLADAGGAGSGEVADKLSAALSDLPLALEQAAATIEQTQTTPAEYLADFENYWAELLGKGRPVGSYSTAIAMAWELSFRKIEQIDPEAADLLMLCSFFAPGEIPLWMIHEASSQLPSDLANVAADPAALHNALATLEKFSLVRVTDKWISIHGVLAALTQDRMDGQARSEWAMSALRVATSAFPYDSQDHLTWPRCAQTLPHVLSAAMNAQRAGLLPGETAELLSKVGRYLLKMANYTEAQSVLELALPLAQSTFGRASGPAADVANNLGRVLHHKGDLQRASEMLEWALSVDQSIYGDSDPHWATTANNLAMTLAVCGKPREARTQFERALEIYQSHYHGDHPKIASVMNNLGFVLAQLGETATARQRFERALMITEETAGQTHPQAACIAVNLADVYRSENRHDEARRLYERALRIDENAFGSSHPSVARDLSRLGHLHRQLGDQPAAVRHLERALAVAESCYGPDQQQIAPFLNDLGHALKDADEPKRASEYFRRVAALRRKSSGESLDSDAMLPRD